MGRAVERLRGGSHSRLLDGLPWTPLLENRNSLLTGKKQGISPIQAFSAKNRLENDWDSSYLRINSLANRTGN